MARAVVIVFDSNELADRFVEEHRPQVEMLIAMPTQFCPQSGSGGCGTGKRIKAWTRGKKFGWWVCTICKKPSSISIGPEGAKDNRLIRNVVSQGVNLLQTLIDQTPATIHDEGWGVYDRGSSR